MAGVRCIAIPSGTYRNSRLRNSMSTSGFTGRRELINSSRGWSLHVVRLWCKCGNAAEIAVCSSVWGPVLDVAFVQVDAIERGSIPQIPSCGRSWRYRRH